MRILVNASTLRSGGAIQKAIEFMSMAEEFGQRDQWLYLLSPEVHQQWAPNRHARHHDTLVIPVSPARILRGRASRAIITSAERRFSPDAAFTVYGPAYYRFRCSHLMGFAVPWVTHPSPLAWSCLPPAERLRMFAWCEYVARAAQLASQWVTETDTASIGLARRLRVDPGLVHTVPNCCSAFYYRAAMKPASSRPGSRARQQDDFRLLTLSAWRAHKRLEMIPDTAAELRRIDPSTRYTFALSLDVDSDHWHDIQRKAAQLDVSQSVMTIGQVPVRDGPSLYRASDAMFLPSILETFSASYPEAMSMGIPIITTDLDFARDVCGDGASYFVPDSPHSAAAAIVNMRTNLPLRQKQLCAASVRLDSFGDRESRFRRYRGIIEAMATGR